MSAAISASVGMGSALELDDEEASASLIAMIVDIIVLNDFMLNFELSCVALSHV